MKNYSPVVDELMKELIGAFELDGLTHGEAIIEAIPI